MLSEFFCRALKNPSAMSIDAFHQAELRAEKCLKGLATKARVRWCEDLLQDLRIRLFEVSDEALSADNSEAFLIQVAKNAAIDHARREGRRSHFVFDSDDDTTSEPDMAERLHHHELLEGALSTLSAAEHDALLSHVAGATDRETAASVGCSQQAISKARKRALRRMRQFVTDHDGE